MFRRVLLGRQIVRAAVRSAPKRAVKSRVALGSSSRAFYASWNAPLKQHIEENIADEQQPNEDSTELDSLLKQHDWHFVVTPAAQPNAQPTVTLSRQHAASQERIDVSLSLDSSNPVVESAAAGCGHHHHHHHEDGVDHADEEQQPEDAGDFAGQLDKFSVRIHRSNNKQLHFDCVAKEGVIFIESVTSGNTTMVFDELPEETQTQLEQYLLDRHINQDFARLIWLALNRSDALHYLQWLRNVKSYLE